MTEETYIKIGGVLESIKSEASYTDQKNLCVRYFIRFSEKV